MIPTATKRYKFAQKCSKILKSKTRFIPFKHSFYLDGVSFISKRKPNHDASIPNGKIWRKRSEGLRLASKGSKSLPGGKTLHFLVAISFNRGVVLAKDYQRMSGKYFSDFVRSD